MSNIAAKHILERRPWTVDFAFRCKDEHQRRLIDSLGLVAHEVVRVWLDVITPGAVVRDPPGNPIGHVLCPSREAARRLCRTFGGHIVSARQKA